jgi:alkanesulfonate monooxygenase SsuD/methylene tetrahydromethanopterin reductase-like flavin-dependent oxidoreductase (luciferase family)
MKLGLYLGYSGATMSLPVEKVQLAERLGYDSVWTAEAYGSDAITPLAYLAAVTRRIRLGRHHATRGPHARGGAMAIATLDALAGGDRAVAASACRAQIVGAGDQPGRPSCGFATT